MNINDLSHEIVALLLALMKQIINFSPARIIYFNIIDLIHMTIIALELMKQIINYYTMEKMIFL